MRSCKTTTATKYSNNFILWHKLSAVYFILFVVAFPHLCRCSSLLFFCLFAKLYDKSLKIKHKKHKAPPLCVARVCVCVCVECAAKKMNMQVMQQQMKRGTKGSVSIFALRLSFFIDYSMQAQAGRHKGKHTHTQRTHTCTA